MKVNANYNANDTIDFTLAGNQLDLSGISPDEEANNEIEDAEYKITFPLTNQLMLQNLIITFLLLL